MKAASATDAGVKIRYMPASYSQEPIQPLRPKRTNSRYPRATGGKTRGNVVRNEAMREKAVGRRANHHASIGPKMAKPMPAIRQV